MIIVLRTAGARVRGYPQPLVTYCTDTQKLRVGGDNPITVVFNPYTHEICLTHTEVAGGNSMFQVDQSNIVITRAPGNIIFFIEMLERIIRAVGIRVKITVESPCDSISRKSRTMYRAPEGLHYDFTISEDSQARDIRNAVVSNSALGTVIGTARIKIQTTKRPAKCTFAVETYTCSRGNEISFWQTLRHNLLDELLLKSQQLLVCLPDVTCTDGMCGSQPPFSTYYSPQSICLERMEPLSDAYALLVYYISPEPRVLVLIMCARRQRVRHLPDEIWSALNEWCQLY